MILAIFDLQVTPMLPTKFQVNWPFSSGEEAKNRFSRWPWPPSWNFDLKNVNYFWSTTHPSASYQVTNKFLIYKSPRCFLSFKSTGLWDLEKKRKIDFHNGSHLGFPIGTTLANFGLQVSPMLLTKFQANWPFSLGKEKNRFSRWPPRRPSWILDRNDFSCFWSTSYPDASYQFWVNWPRGVGEVGF